MIEKEKFEIILPILKENNIAIKREELGERRCGEEDRRYLVSRWKKFALCNSERSRNLLRSRRRKLRLKEE